MNNPSSFNIGLIDSGIGGLSILKTLQQQIPASYIYLADYAHHPYSQKTTAELEQISYLSAHRLIDLDCQVIILACNTLSVSSLGYLRQKFPDIKFIGTVPAIKPAAEQLAAYSHVLVLSTQHTTQSPYLQKLIEPFQTKINFHLVGSTRLVSLIEKNDQNGINHELVQILKPFKNLPLAAVVFGCTHFPFIQKNIEQILPCPVQFFESSWGVTKQLQQHMFKINYDPKLQVKLISTDPVYLDRLKQSYRHFLS